MKAGVWAAEPKLLFVAGEDGRLGCGCWKGDRGVHSFFSGASLEYNDLLQERRSLADSEVGKRMVSSNNSSGRSRSRLDPESDVVFWLACGERLGWSEISTVVMMPVSRRAGMWLSMVSCGVDFRRMMF